MKRYFLRNVQLRCEARKSGAQGSGGSRTQAFRAVGGGMGEEQFEEGARVPALRRKDRDFLRSYLKEQAGG
ncbi:hypothetical protein D3C76_1675930 [compost metagenome]